MIEEQLLRFIVDKGRSDLLYSLRPEDMLNPNVRIAFELLRKIHRKYRRLPDAGLFRRLSKINYDSIPEVTDDEIFIDYLQQYVTRTRLGQLLLKQDGIEQEDVVRIIPSLTNGKKSFYRLSEIDGEVLQMEPAPFSGMQGLYAGDYVIVLGVINSGKTLLLVNIMREYLQKGKRVVYVTFEDTPVKIKRRLIQSTYKVTFEEYVEKKEEYDKRITEYNDRALIIQGVSNKTSVVSLQDYVDEDTVLIVDYLDRLRKTSGELRHALREISETLKGIAVDKKTLIFAGKQSRRKTLSELDLSDSGESYAVMESPDEVISVPVEIKDGVHNKFKLSKARDQHKTDLYLKVLLEQQLVTG